MFYSYFLLETNQAHALKVESYKGNSSTTESGGNGVVVHMLNVYTFERGMDNGGRTSVSRRIVMIVIVIYIFQTCIKFFFPAENFSKHGKFFLKTWAIRLQWELEDCYNERF